MHTRSGTSCLGHSCTTHRVRRRYSSLSGGDEVVDLVDRRGGALHDSHVEDFLQSLGGGVRADEGGPGAPVVLREGEDVLADGQVGVLGELLVEREAVVEGESAGLVDGLDLPVAVVLLTLRTRHVVVHPAAGDKVVIDEGGGVGRGSPDPLELTRVGVDLPDPLRGAVEVRDDGEAPGVEVVRDVGDGHGDQSFWVWVLVGLCRAGAGGAMSSSIREMRPRHRDSSSASIAATDRTAATSPLAMASRPCRRLVSRPALSSTATCFCTAAKLIS